MSVVSGALRAFFNCVQEDNEALSDCTRRFKAAREILQSHLGGPILVTKAIDDTCPAGMQMESNDEGGMDTLLTLDQATMIDDQLSSHVCLKNADQSKFGSVLKGLKSQKILENDQFPRTMQKAHGVLSNFDDWKRHEGHKPKGKHRDKRESKSKNIDIN